MGNKILLLWILLETARRLPTESSVDTPQEDRDKQDLK